MRVSERAEVFEAMAQALDAGRDRLARLAAREVGAATPWVEFNVEMAMGVLRQCAGLGPLLSDRHAVNAVTGVRSTIRREAAGVALGIAPWNAPILLAVRAVAAPLFCGNTVVMKASEHCPDTHAELIALLNVPGLPAGALNVVTNRPDDSQQVVAALIGHPAVRRVNFTGSTRVGRQVALDCARHLKKCLLELSGKAPLIVLEDADLDAAAHAAAFGAFFNQGQICMSTERVIVLDRVADAFVARLVEATRAIRAEDPLAGRGQIGRLVTREAAHRVQALIQDAVERGARLLIGGEAEDIVIQPAVIDGIDPTMRLYHEESFGPIAPIFRVADEEEALSVANDSDYGLSAAVFTADAARAPAGVATGMRHRPDQRPHRA
jgi:acyl-CoA reductase-like NAD-dependent aldehyde dehydrogenase